MDESAILKAGQWKLFKEISIKSTTCSLMTLSKPLPMAPAKINERAIFSTTFLDLLSK